MADTFTNNYNFRKIEVGSSDGVWDDKADANWDLVDTVVGATSGKLAEVGKRTFGATSFANAENNSWRVYQAGAYSPFMEDSNLPITVQTGVNGEISSDFTPDANCSIDWSFFCSGITSSTNPPTAPFLVFKSRLYNTTDAVASYDGSSDYCAWPMGVANANFHLRSCGSGLLEAGKRYQFQYFCIRNLIQSYLSIPPVHPTYVTAFGTRVHANIVFRRQL